MVKDLDSLTPSSQSATISSGSYINAKYDVHLIIIKVHCWLFKKQIQVTNLESSIATYLKRLIFICRPKHLTHYEFTLLWTTKNQALLNHIGSKFLLTHLHNLTCKLANNSRPFVWFTMLQDMLTDPQENRKNKQRKNDQNGKIHICEKKHNKINLEVQA